MRWRKEKASYDPDIYQTPYYNTKPGKTGKYPRLRRLNTNLTPFYWSRLSVLVIFEQKMWYLTTVYHCFITCKQSRVVRTIEYK